MGLREKKRARVRQTILDVCEDLFRTKGFDEAGIDEIIEKSEISRQTFFNYFAGKEAVLTELGLQWLRSQADAPRAGASVEAPKSVLEGISKAISAQAVAIEKDRDFMKLVITRSRLFSPTPPDERDQTSIKKNDHIREIYNSIAKIIEKGQQLGELRDDIDPDQTAVILASSSIMVIRLWLTGYWGTEDDLETRMLGTLDILEKGFKK